MGRDHIDQLALPKQAAGVLLLRANHLFVAAKRALAATKARGVSLGGHREHRRGLARPRHTLGIAALALLIALLISQSAMLRLCETASKKPLRSRPALHRLFA
jgi:hypothetical protein